MVYNLKCKRGGTIKLNQAVFQNLIDKNYGKNLPRFIRLKIQEEIMTSREYIEFIKENRYIQADTEVHECMHVMAREARKMTAKINGRFHTAKKLRKLFSILIGKNVDETFSLFPPFYTDCGKNITVGKNVFINSGCCFQDQGGITIGDGTLIGHQVVLATLNHDLEPQKRKSMIAAPISIGKNVWIGSHTTILSGVTIGDNAVIAAGAVVNRDIPENTVAAGIPAKIIRSIL